MAEKNDPEVRFSDRELHITRLFKAPRDLVFEVWTNPDHIKHWWGPNGFTSTIFEMDVRPGGVWDFVLHGPDGVDYQNKNVYVEVVKPERIVFNHATGPKFQATVQFAEQGNDTLLTFRMLFDTAEQVDKVIREFRADEGMTQNMDRLEHYLSNMETSITTAPSNN